MSAIEAAPDPKPSRASGLLGLVRQLIDYGRELAATFRSSPHPRHHDIALILARITRGLLRAEALEPGSPAMPPDWTRGPRRRALPPNDNRRPPICRRSRPTPPARPTPAPCLPTPEQIAAEVRRRPIGAVIADICRDLGIMPSHPLWRELRSRTGPAIPGTFRRWPTLIPG